MNYIFWVSLLVLIHYSYCSGLQIVSFQGPDIPVKIGDSAKLTCISKIVSDKKKFNVIFQRGVTLLTEGCLGFKPRLKMTCSDNKYELLIKNVTLEDNATWKCSSLMSSSKFKLHVFALNNTTIEIKSHKKVINYNLLKPNVYPLNRIIHTVLSGFGSKENPIDLRNTDKAEIICTSRCGFPVLQHFIQIQNSSKGDIHYNYSSLSNEVRKCSNKNFSTVISKTKFSCLQENLFGLINITCSSYSPNMTSFTTSQGGVYVLCPPQQIQESIFTFGEKVNLVIGCLLAFILVIFFILLLCRWNSDRYKDFDDTCQTALFPNMQENEKEMIRGYRV